MTDDSSTFCFAKQISSVPQGKKWLKMLSPSSEWNHNYIFMASAIQMCVDPIMALFTKGYKLIPLSQCSALKEIEFSAMESTFDHMRIKRSLLAPSQVVLPDYMFFVFLFIFCRSWEFLSCIGSSQKLKTVVICSSTERGIMRKHKSFTSNYYMHMQWPYWRALLQFLLHLIPEIWTLHESVYDAIYRFSSAIIWCFKTFFFYLSPFNTLVVLSVCAKRDTCIIH